MVKMLVSSMVISIRLAGFLVFVSLLWYAYMIIIDILK